MSRWQDYRENEERAGNNLEIARKAHITVPAKPCRKVCVKAVDIFGFESQAIAEVET
jgi:hypothetical protein